MTGALAALNRGRVVDPVEALATPALLQTTSASSPITSSSTTVAVTGGVGPFTYAWEWVNNPNSMTILSASSATTTFRKSGAVSGEAYAGVAVCKVTDTGNGSSIAYSNDVSIELDRS